MNVIVSLLKSIIESRNIWKLIEKRTLEKNLWWLGAWPRAPLVSASGSSSQMLYAVLHNRQRCRRCRRLRLCRYRNRSGNGSGSAASSEKSGSSFKQVFDKSRTSQRQVTDKMSTQNKSETWSHTWPRAFGQQLTKQISFAHARWCN